MAAVCSMRQTISDLSNIGVTRVGDLTDLDIIGLPVWFASRPNAYGLSQTQGKGLTHEDAQLSAIMEAAEQHYAERAYELQGVVRASMVDVEREAIPVTTLSGCLTNSLDAESVRTWCPGINLYNGQKCLAPFELVGLDFRLNQGWDRKSFRFSTVGLAAGNSRKQAILHGLMESIENDATILVDALGFRLGLETPVTIPSGLHADLDFAINKVQLAGLTVEFSVLYHATGLPVVGAHISSVSGNYSSASSRNYSGFACRLDPQSAAIAALLEAAQSRVTDIAGSRDDIDAKCLKSSSVKFPAGVTSVGPNLFEHCNMIADEKEDIDTRLQITLSKLELAGVKNIYCFDLVEPQDDYAVVRILCPDLGHASEGGVVELGTRGIAAFLRLRGNSI